MELYTRHSCLAVTAVDLAVMGATLADGGVHPVSRRRVVDLAACRATLAVMVTAGMYEASGDWLVEVGLPGKSGIGGGMVTVSPGKGALGTFSPPLDAAGNSVRGRLAAALLSRAIGLDLLTPIAMPANMMVMNPAGYRFGDYWKLGLPVMAWWLVVCLVVIPLVWKF